jgi:hypothetical protein
LSERFLFSAGCSIRDKLRQKLTVAVTAPHELPVYVPSLWLKRPNGVNLASSRSELRYEVQDVHAQTSKGVAMSKTTDRILIAVLLIVAVAFVTRDARAGILVKCASYAGSPSSSRA